MSKTNNDKRILKEFDKEFPSYQTQDIGEDFKLEAIRNFISKALQQAREEERKEIMEIVEREIRNYENAEAEDINCNSYEREIQVCKDIKYLIQDK